MFLSLIFFFVLCAAAAHFVGALLPVVVRYAVRRGFADQPEGRKVHDRPVPPVGGLVIFPLFMILLPVLGFSVVTHAPLFIALALLLVIGCLDDYYDLAAHWKFLGQAIVALLLTMTGEALLPHLGHLFGVDHRVDLLWLSVPFTAVCLIFLMNAMNMIDGVDGLAGGISFVMLGWLAVAALMGGNEMQASSVLLLMALLFGFLLHNMRYPGHKRATVFLGDAGSMALGLVIAWLGINITTSEAAGMPPIGMALIIAVPIIDAFALFIVRKRSGRRAFQAGRDHLHHRLMAAGLTPGQVALTMMIVVFILGALGVLGGRVGIDEGFLTLLWLFLLAGYTFDLVRHGTSLYRQEQKETLLRA